MSSRGLAAVVDPRRPPAHALLVDLARVHRAARVLAADVEPVRARGREADELVVPVDRPEDGRIVQVRAGHVRVVHVEDVTGPKRLPAEHLRGELHADLEVAEEQRQPERLAEHVAVLVEDRDRAVLALVDDRRVRAADQGCVHVLCAGDERVANDLGRDRIGARRASGGFTDGHFVSSLSLALVITMLPCSSSAATCPGGTSVVELCSSITTGPSWRLPNASRSRSSTGVSCSTPANTTVRGTEQRLGLRRPVRGTGWRRLRSGPSPPGAG